MAETARVGRLNDPCDVCLDKSQASINPDQTLCVSLCLCVEQKEGENERHYSSTVSIHLERKLVADKQSAEDSPLHLLISEVCVLVYVDVQYT